MRIYILLFCIFLIVIFSCNEKKENLNRNTIMSTTLNKFFEINDSLILEYPIDSSPSFIRDICFTGENYYVLGSNRKYPLVKFDKKGNFIKNIGKIGNGPGEFIFFIHKIAINKNKEIVAKTLSFNQLYLIKNDSIVFRKTLGEAAAISDIGWLSNDKILCTGYGRGKWHYLIFNKKLELTDTLVELKHNIVPEGFIENFSLNIKENEIISHHLYPAKIYFYNFKNNHLIKKREIYFQNYLTDFKKVDLNKILENYHNGKISLIQMLYSFPKIMWLTRYNKLITGIYYAARTSRKISKRKEKKFYLFILNLENNKVKDFELEPGATKDLYCWENGFFISKSQKINEKIFYKLYFLNLRDNIDI